MYIHRVHICPFPSRTMEAKDWMLLVATCGFFYDPDDQLMDNAEEQRTLLRQAMNAFSGNAPTYTNLK